LITGHITAQQLHDAGLDVSALRRNFSSAKVFNQHEVIRHTDVAAGKAELYEELADLCTLKPMREMRCTTLNSFKKMPWDTDGWRPLELGLLKTGQCRPAESPLEPGLHMACFRPAFFELRGEEINTYIYWFGMA
jgi:hypothetical protein